MGVATMASYGSTGSFSSHGAGAGGYNALGSSSSSYLSQAQENLQSLSSLVQRMNTMNQMINTASDSPKHREDLKEVRQSAKTLIQQIAGLLDATPSPTDEALHSRLIKEFGDVVSQCKQSIQTGIQKENALPSRDVVSQTYGNDVSLRMKEYEAAMDQITIVESASVQVDNAVIRETNQGMHNVYNKLSDLHEISKDTSMLVESQQGMFDHAEKASSAANARSKQAVTFRNRNEISIKE